VERRFERLRKLREVLEPIAASAYFSPEPLQSLGGLGLDPLEAYFCGRSAPIGVLSPASAVSIFGFFKPDLVKRAIETGWKKTTPEKAIDARLEGISKAFRRLLEGENIGRALEALRPVGDALESVPSISMPFFEAWRSVEIGDEDEYLQLWRICDLFREHRGGLHEAAWATTGLTAPEAVVLSKLWWGMTDDSYLRVHGWSKDDCETALQSLEKKGLAAQGAITSEGLRLRDEVEELTDRGQDILISSVGEKALEDAGSALEPLSRACIDRRGYPLRQVPRRARH